MLGMTSVAEAPPRALAHRHDRTACGTGGSRACRSSKSSWWPREPPVSICGCRANHYPGHASAHRRPRRREVRAGSTDHGLPVARSGGIPARYVAVSWRACGLRGSGNREVGGLAAPRIPPGGVLVGRRTTPVRLPPRPCRPGADEPLPFHRPYCRSLLVVFVGPRWSSVLLAKRKDPTLKGSGRLHARIVGPPHPRGGGPGGAANSALLKAGAGVTDEAQ